MTTPEITFSLESQCWVIRVPTATVAPEPEPTPAPVPPTHVAPLQLGQLPSLKQATLDARRSYVNCVMEATGNNIQNAVRIMGISLATFYRLYQALFHTSPRGDRPLVTQPTVSPVPVPITYNPGKPQPKPTVALEPYEIGDDDLMEGAMFLTRMGAGSNGPVTISDVDWGNREVDYRSSDDRSHRMTFEHFFRNFKKLYP